jgi:hypothetical protein
MKTTIRLFALATIFLFHSGVIRSQGYIGASAHVIPQFYAAFGGSLEYGFTDFGGIVSLEACGMDRAVQYHLSPNSQFEGQPKSTISYFSAPKGGEFMLSASYCYSFTSWLFVGPIVGLAARSQVGLFQTYYPGDTMQVGGIHVQSPSSSATFENGVVGSDNVISYPTKTVFVGNFGATFKIIPFSLEYSTEGGFAAGVEIPLFSAPK